MLSFSIKIFAGNCYKSLGKRKRSGEKRDEKEMNGNKRKMG